MCVEFCFPFDVILMLVCLFLLGGKVLTLTSSCLMSFLQKKKGDKDDVSMGAEKDIDVDVAQSSARPTHQVKRKMFDSKKSLEVLSEEEIDVGTGGRTAFEKQKRLHGYADGAGV
ncbi:uncharacterized protein DS421_8g230670 [Arachis hypogaea]|nr:uncharacterized protein DS421_8g230670 [Arachis hypogaea]